MQSTRNLVESGQGGWVPRGLLGPTSDDLAHLASAQGWRFIEASLAGVADKKTLMRVLAESLRLPESFGSNWDALADSLWDLGEGFSGVILRLKGLGEVPQRLAEPLSEILDERTAQGPVPLIVVADPPLPAVAAAQTAS